MAILEIERVSYRYSNGTLALDGTSLAIEAGECVAISGENGAGKTTLLKSIMGLLKPSQGRICLYGEDIARSSTARLARKLGFVFQNPRNQIFLRSVSAEVSFGPRRLGMSPGEIASRAKQAIDVTGLAGQEDTHPYDLSPGQRKLLAIACALALDPQILILDEPTSGMDFSESERARQVMLSYPAQGRAVILATHDMDLAARCAPRMVILQHGQMVADGETHAILSRRDLLASAHLETTAISQLASACDLPASILTVAEMVETIGKKRGADE